MTRIIGKCLYCGMEMLRDARNMNPPVFGAKHFFVRKEDYEVELYKFNKQVEAKRRRDP